MEKWVPVATTVIGILLGSLLTFASQWMQFKRQQKLENSRLKLLKLEQLFEVLTEIQRSYQSLFSSHTDLMLSAEVAAQLPKMAAPKDEVVPIPFSKMQMLITMYAPSLMHLITVVMRLRDKIGEMHVSSIIDAERMSPEDRRDLWNKSSGYAQELEATIRNAHKEVATLASTLVS